MYMIRNIITIMVLAISWTPMKAQILFPGDDDGQDLAGLKHSVVTNGFWSNWFVEANATFSAFWSDQEEGLPGGIAYDFRNNIGLSFAIGKWFTPGIGLRTKINGFWGRCVATGEPGTDANKYFTIQEQALFNLSNMLYGYKPERLYNCIPYVGFGVGRSMTYNSSAFGLSLGLKNTFRIDPHLSVNAEVGYSIYEADFDGKTAETFNGRHDRMLTFEVGITYHLGKSKWEKAPDVEGVREMYQTENDALNALIQDLQMENDDLRRQLEGDKQQ